MQNSQKSEQDHPTPLPRLIIVSGKPGSGKSTLAKELARGEHLGLPLLSRDAIKAGMVETWAFARSGASRHEIETDELRSTLVPNSYDLFYKTMTCWLQAGVSLIAEYGFDRRSESALKPIIKIAKAVLVRCECPDEVAQRRFIEREQNEGKIRPDRLANMPKRIALATDPWSRFETMHLPIPTFRIDTRDGYKPALNELTAFCRDPNIASGQCIG